MSEAASQAAAWPIYRRLLGYARPHLGMFMIGVAGVAVFAATEELLVATGDATVRCARSGRE